MQALMRGWGMLAVMVVGIGLSTNAGRLEAQTVRRPAQGQAAWQFLNAVLHGNYQSAYSRLAPEVRQSINLEHFEAQARPIWKSGQRHGSAIELYKLGMRLGERGSSRLFYSFSFAADSAMKPPSELLEITFRDTTTRAVLGFGLRIMAQPAKKVAPAAKKQAVH